MVIGANPHRRREHRTPKARRKNPAELVLMSANPLGDAVDAGGAADGSRSAAAAERMYERFSALPVKWWIVAEEPLIPAGNYAGLGKTRTLAFKPINGGPVLEIWWKDLKSKPELICDPRGERLFLAGGDQDLDASIRSWGMSPYGVINLGKAREIVYWTRKAHEQLPAELRGVEVEYAHEFGEECSHEFGECLPDLFYDAKVKRLLFRGGGYRIEDRGIIN